MPRYDQARFLTTHNSYSGDINGKRKTLRAQLDKGVRCVEFDFHDDGYAEPTIEDYRIGHFGPGAEVDHTADNPADSLLLTDWLKVLTKWSSENPGHAPITVVLDLKDALTDNPDGGDITDLNATLQDVFKAQLFSREDYDLQDEWPEWEDLKNKFVCVLSGNMRTRGCYRWDFGIAPAIGVNAAGDVVLVFAEESGDLSAWSGKAVAAAEEIAWSRRITYAQSNKLLFEPAVAINDDGWVVAVHRLFHPQIPDGLWSHLGRLKPDGRIEWQKPKSFALGNFPSLEIDGLEITEIHTQSGTGKHRKVTGTIDPAKKRIDWKGAQATQQKPFPTDIVQFGAATISCGSHKTNGWLGCRFDSKPLLPARFAQLAFVEMQDETQRPSLIDPLFFGAPAGSTEAISKARKAGLVARGWGFRKEQAEAPSKPKENFAAADTPFAAWYTDYMQGNDVVAG